MGLFFSLLQLSLTSFGYYTESRRSSAMDHFSNNIMRVTVLQKQVFTVIVPVVYNLTKFFHLRPLEWFHAKTATFDDMIRRGTWTQQMNGGRTVDHMQDVTHRLNYAAVLFFVVVETVNLIIGYIYTRDTAQANPGVAIFYFYQVTIVNFLGTALYIGIRLNGIRMRLQVLLELQRSILRDITRMELEKRRICVLFQK